ncbi:MAG: DinB family protein [Trueperaceae bacterium]|nr:MAG: DinB family protein [Trueperaceae bacterium]
MTANRHLGIKWGVDPYIDRILTTLGNRDPIVVLEATPKQLEAYLVRFSEHDFERSYAPGKWSARAILAHLADVELGLGFRFRQALVEPGYRPDSFDQDLWARRYARLDPSLAVETFRALRAWNLALFATFELDDWLKEVSYPFAGIDTVDMMVRFLAGHDLNHLLQLETIAGL